MAINVFEGARRITIFIAIVYTICWIGIYYPSYVPPPIKVIYHVSSLKEPPIRVKGAYCPSGLAPSTKGVIDGPSIDSVIDDPSIDSVIDESSIDGFIKYKEIITSSGTEAKATLCINAFLWEPVEEAQKNKKTGKYRSLIKGKWVNVEKTARNDKGDIIALRRSGRDYKFTLSEAEEAWIDNQFWIQVRNELWKRSLGIIGGLLFLWVFTWTIGWIVRGFMGIPRGQDNK